MIVTDCQLLGYCNIQHTSSRKETTRIDQKYAATTTTEKNLKKATENITVAF